ncbi:N-acetylmuramoyl-L-alanine amidase [Amycolatopsis bartoniae]|uniref:N-acetylmuramoyl-L-alanine amidase n=2 Tax=Amycolatopsis bartoniae TaxID=941986 RepID=A0A8H9MCY7_9PSEU|nr:N-acetylmuramoyl-L-alanine amidase [Amycolatopsis bartoniae]GHF75357.1 N-acetylmuramoyl-L-alanine amidase [Amycolatopsis bartoniae]
MLAGSLLLTSCTAHVPAPLPSPAATISAVAPSLGSPAPTVARKGPVVVLDPGHNGGNASHPREIDKPVPAGRGETKPCNTTGTATKSGYPEHAFNWDVAQRVGALLTARGILVQYTRQDDNGVGPCVDRRAAFGNDSGAAAVVAIHADGSTSSSAHGFHVSYSDPPLNEAQGQPSVSLAEALRDGLRQAGFATSTYLGKNGIYPRDDLAGLNLSTRPAALVECGNMRNAAEAAAMSSPEGRARYAQALATAILAYLKV